MKEENQYICRAIIIGSIAGVVEVGLNHPLWVMKARMQIGVKMPFQIQSLYHGIFANMITMAPMMALKITASTSVGKHLDSFENLTPETRLVISGLFGGCISSLVSSPIEYIRSNQIKIKATFSESVRFLYHNYGYGFVKRGLFSTAMRDSIYTFGFYSLTPLVNNRIQSIDTLPQTTILGAGLVSGIFSAYASHPFDSIKSEQQFNPHYKNIYKTILNIYSNGGLYGFFRGGLPRILRVMSATAIVPTTIEMLDNNLDNEGRLCLRK